MWLVVVLARGFNNPILDTIRDGSQNSGQAHVPYFRKYFSSIQATPRTFFYILRIPRPEIPLYPKSPTDETKGQSHLHQLTWHPPLPPLPLCHMSNALPTQPSIAPSRKKRPGVHMQSSKSTTRATMACRAKGTIPTAVDRA